MSVAKKRIEELSSLLAEDQLREVADFMSFLINKEDKTLLNELIEASESSLAFWDNDEDEVWSRV